MRSEQFGGLSVHAQPRTVDIESKPATIRESHPEIAFWALNDQEPVASSKTSDESGIDDRLAILEEYDDTCPSVYEELVASHIDDHEAWGRRFSTSNRDDLVDAMCLALTAWLADGSFETLPDSPQTDTERHVPMEIVCADSGA